LHERIENKLFLDRTRKDSNFKRPHIYATLFQIEKCCLTGEATPELDALCRPGTATGTRVAAFNPIHPDTANLFAAVLSGDFTINGFRNRDLQGKLYPAAAKDAAETKRRTHRTSRLIAKLRGHGLITRVKNSRLYRLTARGLKAMWPAVRFRRVDFPSAFREAQAA
jgi:hypothetical protein